MAVRIKELINSIIRIRDMADGAVSFKSKCRATRANVMHLWEFLDDLKDLEHSHASALEESLEVVKAVLLKAEQVVKDNSQLGWLEEFWTMYEMASEFNELERRFLHGRKGAIALQLLHIN